jgi:hypothetical protein
MRRTRRIIKNNAFSSHKNIYNGSIELQLIPTGQKARFTKNGSIPAFTGQYETNSSS